jgi:hypothetical protein
MDIEKVTGGTFGDWSTLLEKGSMLALTAMVWIIQRRDNPQLKFSEVNFEIGSLEIEDEEAEKAEKAAGAEGNEQPG